MRALLPSQAQFGVAAALQTQLRVTLFVGRCRHVHAVGKQLVIGRCTLGAAQAGRSLPARTQRGAQTQGQAARRKAAGLGVTKTRRGKAGRITIGKHTNLLCARPGTPGQRPQCQLFQDKEGLRLGSCAGHKSLFAQRREGQVLCLQTPDPFDTAQRRMARLQAQVLAAALEGGAHLARAFHFIVPIPGQARARIQAAQPALAPAPFAGQGRVIALHADDHVGFGRHAVAVVQGVHRDTDKTGVGHPGRAHGAALGARRRVAHPRARLQRRAVFHRRVARCALVITLAPHQVNMPGPAPSAAVQHRSGTAFLGGTAPTHVGPAAQALGRQARNAVVQHIDHAAGGVAPIEQSRRAAQHFDALGHQGVHRHGVVKAEVGRIHRRAAVFQQPHPVTVQAANHRAAGVGAKAAAGHAEQAVQGFAQG